MDIKEYLSHKDYCDIKNVSNIIFEKEYVISGKYENYTFTNVTFESKLSNIKFDNCTFYNCRFIGVEFTYCLSNNCTYKECIFRSCTYDGITIIFSTLSNNDIQDGNIIKEMLIKASDIRHCFINSLNISNDRYYTGLHLTNSNIIDVGIRDIITSDLGTLDIDSCICNNIRIQKITSLKSSVIKHNVITQLSIKNAIIGNWANVVSNKFIKLYCEGGIHILNSKITDNVFDNCSMVPYHDYFYKCDIINNITINSTCHRLVDNSQITSYESNIRDFSSKRCPEEGSFIGYKIVSIKCEPYIAVLEIPADAKRCSAFGNKCRCSKAKVLRFEDLDGVVVDYSDARSYMHNGCIYKVGEIVYPHMFDDNWQHECSGGIHFCMTRSEAIKLLD